MTWVEGVPIKSRIQSPNGVLRKNITTRRGVNMVDEVEKNENMNEADASLIKAVATFAHSTTLHVKEVFRGESYGVYGKRNPIFIQERQQEA